MRFNRRSVVVTGAGSGIGRACAKEFAKEGAWVVVAAIHCKAADETASQIASLGGVALALEVDVSKPESVLKLVDETLRAFSEVHVLLNNAAIVVSKTVEDTTVEEWNRELAST